MAGAGEDGQEGPVSGSSGPAGAGTTGSIQVAVKALGASLQDDAIPPSSQAGIPAGAFDPRGSI